MTPKQAMKREEADALIADLNEAQIDLLLMPDDCIITNAPDSTTELLIERDLIKWSGWCIIRTERGDLARAALTALSNPEEQQ